MELWKILNGNEKGGIKKINLKIGLVAILGSYFSWMINSKSNDLQIHI
jgi:hypothetical protein